MNNLNGIYSYPVALSLSNRVLGCKATELTGYWGRKGVRQATKKVEGT